MFWAILSVQHQIILSQGQCFSKGSTRLRQKKTTFLCNSHSSERFSLVFPRLGDFISHDSLDFHGCFEWQYAAFPISPLKLQKEGFLVVLNSGSFPPFPETSTLDLFLQSFRKCLRRELDGILIFHPLETWCFLILLTVKWSLLWVADLHPGCAFIPHSCFFAWSILLLGFYANFINEYV